MPTMFGPLLVAFALGLLLASSAAWLIARANIARVRRAEQRARAAERLAEVGAMTGGLAHEIKNPLSTIGLNLQLLMEALEDAPLPDADRARLHRRAETVHREAERLRAILADFLEYAGEIHLHRAPADLNAVAEELADFFLPQAQQSGVRLRVEPAPAGPAIAEVDTAALKQAALNLMLNAVQAMSQAMSQAASQAAPQATPPGASLERGAEAPAARPRELILRVAPALLQTADDALALHVIDTGPGIAPDRAARVFEPYYTTKAGGSGLGLPTSRRIAEAHGGRLDLFSEVGRGTDFALVVPRVAPPPRAG